MSEDQKKSPSVQPGTNTAEAKKWLKDTLNQAVYDLVDQDIFDGVLVEAKPAWVLPHTLLIGKIRNKDSNASTRWFIGGDCPTSHTPEEMAVTPRQAARHFAMSWQASLGEQLENLDETQQKILQQAEALYELTQVDEIWPNSVIH